jgi:phosphoribosylglycinamide formyltransferase 1
MKKKLPIGILVSGSGSNLQSIIHSIEQGRLDVEIKVVISNIPDAYALKRAQNHSLSTLVIQHEAYETREAFDEAIVRVLQAKGVELVVMAGFMRIITPVLLQAYPGKIMNIHPALLPSFPGMHAQRQAVDYGVKFSGCTVHFLDSGVDSGPIIIQAVVPVLDDDTEESLAERILKEEHRVYPQAIQFFASGRIQIKNRRVIVSEGNCEEFTSIYNPALSEL